MNKKLKIILLVIIGIILFATGVVVGKWWESGNTKITESRIITTKSDGKTLLKVEAKPTDPYKGPNVIRYKVKIKDLPRFKNKKLTVKNNSTGNNK